VRIEGIGASSDTVKKFADELEDLQADHRESSSTVSEAWKRAEEAQVNRWALKVVLGLRKCSEDRRSDRRRALIAYLEWLLPEEPDLVDRAQAKADDAAGAIH